MVIAVLLLMLLRMGKNLLLCGVQRDLIEPLPFNCRCLSRLLQVGAGLPSRAARGMATDRRCTRLLSRYGLMVSLAEHNCCY